MVAHDNPITANLYTLLCIRDVLNAFDRERLATADILPSLDEPRHLLPTVRPPVPDIVDPFRTRLVRHGLRIDTIFRQPLPEYRVGETNVRADTVVEGVVGSVDVVVAPAELPCVDGQDTGREARVVGTLEQRYGELVIVRHVQLEEPRSVAVSFGDILDRRRTGGAETVWQIQLFRNFGDGKFAQRMVDLVDAYGREANRCADLVAPDLVCGVALVGVHQHTWDDLVSEEGLSVGEMGVTQAGIGRGVQPATFR